MQAATAEDSLQLAGAELGTAQHQLGFFLVYLVYLCEFKISKEF